MEFRDDGMIVRFYISRRRSRAFLMRWLGLPTVLALDQVVKGSDV